MKRFLSWSLPCAGVLLLCASFALALRAGGFTVPSIALAAVGFILFCTLFIRAEIARFGHALASTLYTSLILGTVVVIYLFALRHDARFDLTGQRIHTLTEGTTRYLRLLAKPVEIVVFDSEEGPYRELLDQYARANPEITWKLRDARRDPVFTKQFDDQVVDQTLYIRHGDKKKRLSRAELTEGTVTNAIVEVTRESEVSVLFLTGHGELKSDAELKRDPGSARVLSDFIAGRAMKVGTLNLGEKGYIPKETTLLILAGPVSDLLPAETRQIAEFLGRGGRMLLFYDLPPQTGTHSDFPNLSTLLKASGVSAPESVIIDLRGTRELGSPLKSPAAWTNGDHPVTAALAKAGGAPMVLTLVRALEPVEGTKDFQVTPLLASSDEAWPEPVANIGRKVNAPSTMTRQLMGLAVQGHVSPNGGSPMRMVVFGTSELVRDNYLPTSNSAALVALGALTWLAEQDDSIPIPNRAIQGTPMILGDAQTRLVLIFLVILFPSALLFGGVTYTRLRARS